jgi:large subunit ribosomal protein L18
MSDKQLVNKELKARRRNRVRAKISGTPKIPRLNVFRSLKYVKAQLIDDVSGKTLAYASDEELKKSKGTKTEKSKEVGKLIAKKALEKDIKQAVFDRASYKYHGRIKAVAEGAREAGLQF